MANLLNRYKNQLVKTAGNRSYDYIDVISKVDVTGDFKRVYDVETIINSWSNILMTPTKTYIFDPDYGSDIYKYIYEPQDNVSLLGIEKETKEKLIKYDSRAKITRVDITYLTDTKGFAVDIFFTYKEKKEKMNVVLLESMYFNILQSV
jgi:phage baseplate assembly protein W